jgi:hypothetical protein
MSGGVRNVAIRRCSFLGTDIGLRFKTTRGRGGVVENIYASQINMQGIKGDAIRFNMYYAAKDPVPLNGEQIEIPKEELQPVTAGTPQFRHFYISDVNCSGADHSLFFRGLPEMAIKDIHLKNLVMETRKGIELIQATGIDIQHLKGRVTNPRAALLTLNNTRISSFQNLDLRHVNQDSSGAGRGAGIMVAGGESGGIIFKGLILNGRPVNRLPPDMQFNAAAMSTSVKFK